MERDNKESSGVVCAVSKQAGTVAGTSVVISKKITGLGVKTVTSAKDWLGRSLKILTSTRDKKSSAASQASALESRDELETGRKKAAKALIAALESDLAAAQRELKKAHSNAEKTRSNLASQLSNLEAEKESLVSDLEQVKNQATGAAVREVEVKTRVAALESDLTAAQRQLEMPHKKEEEYAKSQLPSDISGVQAEEETMVSTEEEVESAIELTVAQSVEAEMPAPVAVTDKQVQAAVFPNATDRIIFTRAFSDIASQDARVRANAVRIIAGLNHNKLSVKVLAAQMASEPSMQVRQECIKALATLETKEGLGVVERALTDQAASVRLAAVWGLYRLAGAESGPALVRMFSDEDEAVRRRAATCIGWLGQEELAVKLLPLLADSSVSVRQAAVEAMGSLRSRQVVSTLIEYLNDPEKSVRKAIIDALKKITGKKMSGPFPKDKKSLQRLIMRWQQWWKDELLGG
jgi:HEAT repeat protein